MIRFLINRPIAVCMTFIAILMLGIVSYGLLPTSLMPNIDIPEITVQASYPNSSAREFENAITKTLRMQLVQVAHLRDIVTETRDGISTIRLSFDYGTSIDYAFIEVNEKIDGAMGYLPRDMERPRVMKASATDLPVFYLNISLKSDSLSQEKTITDVSDKRFLELSKFCDQVIRRRIEQLPEVAMVDMSGTIGTEILIKPDKQKLTSLDITNEQIQQAIEQNNIDPGSIMVRDGFYQFHVRFGSQLKDVSDIGNIYIPMPNKLIQLKDIAQIEVQPQKTRGVFLTNNQPGITMAIIQQADARMADLKKQLHILINSFEKDYPDIAFEVTRDQSQLLDFSISNLQQELFMGGIMAFLVLFLFLNDFRAPVLIGLTVPISLIISFLFFNLMHLSINIISLAGLGLGIGMIIDCSIIVIENIIYYRSQGLSLYDACIRGTTEVIRPMLSSTLSTSAVFIPLVFISGMAGALFYDEAVSVSIGNMASFIVSVTLLPVLFLLIYKKSNKPNSGSTNNRFAVQQFRKLSNLLKKINLAHHLEKGYERGVEWVFDHKKTTVVLFLGAVLMSVVFFRILPKEAIPQYKQSETLVTIEWNENIHINESKRRTVEFLKGFDNYLLQSNCLLGEQQFLLNRNKELDYFETEWYLKLKNADSLSVVKDSIQSTIMHLYPLARISFRPPETIFERIFTDNDPPLLAKVSVPSVDKLDADSVLEFTALADASVHASIANRIPLKQYITIGIDPEKLLIYGVDYTTILQSINTAFNENRFATLRSYQQFQPIILGDDSQMVSDVLASRKVPNKSGEMIPISALLKVKHEQDLKCITAGQQGEYIPLQYSILPNELENYKKSLQTLVKERHYPDIQFEGSLMKSRRLINELSIILLISLLLLYFILAAQFESLLQPFIVLLELPADIAGALFLLWLFGSSLNIMSGIGIIIMSGVIINDSILKVDTINQMRKQGLPLMDAIKQGGKLRLGSILMTAFTTIFAVVPFFFGSDLGSALQKPLSLALIGGMLMGTMVSLFVVPLVYWAIYRKGEEKRSLIE